MLLPKFGTLNFENLGNSWKNCGKRNYLFSLVFLKLCMILFFNSNLMRDEVISKISFGGRIIERKYFRIYFLILKLRNSEWALKSWPLPTSDFCKKKNFKFSFIIKFPSKENFVDDKNSDKNIFHKYSFFQHIETNIRKWNQIDCSLINQGSEWSEFSIVTLGLSLLKEFS